MKNIIIDSNISLEYENLIKNCNILSKNLKNDLLNDSEEKGTIDFHSQTLGFATFDIVGDVSSEEGVKSINLNRLNELISKSMLVSLYEHY